jgi:hypothetical protein
MVLRSLSLVLAATGIALAFYRLGQQSTPASGPEDSLEPPDANTGERLQDLKLANAGMGVSPDDVHEDLLTPPRGDEPQSDTIRPGLPDFWRGA